MNGRDYTGELIDTIWKHKKMFWDPRKNKWCRRTRLPKKNYRYKK